MGMRFQGRSCRSGLDLLGNVFYSSGSGGLNNCCSHVMEGGPGFCHLVPDFLSGDP